VTDNQAEIWGMSVMTLASAEKEQSSSSSGSYIAGRVLSFNRREAAARMMDCTEGSPEGQELAALTDAIEA
jgi:hypothetical protein